MALEVGTVIQMTRDAPYKEYGVYKGDIGIINYVASTRKYSIHIYGKSNPHKDACDENRLYGKQGDFWIPFDYVNRYQFKKGDRIRIINKKSKYYGFTGTVACDAGWHYVCVYIDNTDYQPYQGGFNKYLTYINSSVELIDVNNKGESNMKLSGYKNVAVIEFAGNDYNYALYDEDIKANDKVIVTGRLATDILTVKEVLTTNEARERYSANITEEVRCKVDLSAYNKRVEDRKEAEKLRKKMDEEIKKMDELNKYEMYADRNPALREMLEQLKSLGV